MTAQPKKPRSKVMRDFACARCPAAANAARLPDGWKTVGAETLCKACRDRAFVVRAPAMVVKAVDGMEWKEFRALMDRCWLQSACLANWLEREIFKADEPRLAGTEKLPSLPAFDPYRRFNGSDGRGPGYPERAAWDGATQTANAVLRRVWRNYKEYRKEIAWTFQRARSNHRRPMPWFVDADECTLSLDSTGRLFVRAKIGGAPRMLELRRGPKWRRQEADFRLLLAGAAVKVEIAICRHPKKKEIVVKLAGWFPRPPQSKGGRTMLVRTDPNALWVAELEGRPPWILNADHARRWQVAHKVYLQRTAEDTKREKRWPKAHSDRINKARRLRCDKHAARMDTWNDTATKMLAEFARRNGVGEVLYDDARQGYFADGYPWHDLRTKLARKLADRGIAMTSTDGSQSVALAQGA